MMTITAMILRVLADAPDGLTSREVAAATSMASYTVSNKLSKLAAYGIIRSAKVGRGTKLRYRTTPAAGKT